MPLQTQSSCSQCAVPPHVTVHICRPPERRSTHAPRYREAPEYRAAAIPTTARIIESVPMMYAPVYAAPAPMRTIAMPTTEVRMISTAAAPRAAERSLDGDCPAGCQRQLNELSSDIERLAGELNKLQSTVEKQTELLKDIYSQLPPR